MQTDVQEALRHFNEAAQQLNRTWEQAPPKEQDELNEGYPFDESFDEIAHQVGLWALAQGVREEVGEPG